MLKPGMLRTVTRMSRNFRRRWRTCWMTSRWLMLPRKAAIGSPRSVERSRRLRLQTRSSYGVIRT